METGNFKVLMDIETEKYSFAVMVTEHNDLQQTTYQVVIEEPEGFCTFNEIEQPLTMLYDADADRLKFVSMDDLGFLRQVEDKLSDAIMKHNEDLPNNSYATR